MPVTGNGSWLASYSTSPTSCLSCSRVRSALSSSAVSAPPVEGVSWVVVMGVTLPNADNLRNSTSIRRTHCQPPGAVVDDLDRRLLALFAADPRIGVLQASRELGVARGTVQARLDKLVSTGVITGWGPELSPGALGFPVTAFLTLEIRQEDATLGGHDTVARHLATI